MLQGEIPGWKHIPWDHLQLGVQWEPQLGMMIHQFKWGGGSGTGFADDDVDFDKLYGKTGEYSGLKHTIRSLSPWLPPSQK